MTRVPTPRQSRTGESTSLSALLTRLNDLRADPTPLQPTPAPQPNWKVLLALLSLCLSALLWFEGLASSLARPSVNADLDLHQLELSSLVAKAIPGPLSPLLVGDVPRQRLAEQLERQINGWDPPATALQRLELALLERDITPAKADEELRELIPMVEAERRPLLQALLRGERLPPDQQPALLRPWKASTLVAQLSCEQLAGSSQECPGSRQIGTLVLRLLGVTVLPGLLLLSGAVLIIRELWMLARGRLPAGPPLLGPPLGLVDATLLIAGGFVLVGEVLLPQVLLQPLQALLHGLVGSETLAQGLQVLLLYLALTLVPLGLLQIGRAHV